MFRSCIISLLTLCLILIECKVTSKLQLSNRERGFSKILNDVSSIRPARLESISRFTSEDIRLPSNVIPINYNIEMKIVLDPNISGLELYTAPATIKITVTCNESTDRITMHASPMLTITEDSVKVVNTETLEEIPIGAHAYNETLDFYTIVLLEGNNLEIGSNYEIQIEYVAPISRDRVDGLYLSEFRNPDSSVINFLASTQFAGAFARQVLPCFDEPNLKATFDLKIGHDEKYIALSNSRIIESSTIPDMTDWIWDTFERTNTMSPYLLAFIVANYTYEESDIKLADEKPVRVYAPPHLIAAGGGVYASDATANLTLFYEDYFGIKYQMPKMDSAIVPSFYFGGMENWGLINYREVYLLYFDETTEAERWRINSITSHESSHMWFGNLVTCKWWDSVWLNEGSATYFSFLGVDAVFPEFEAMDTFLNEVVHLAMIFDSDSATTHPVLNEVTFFPEDIMVYYDLIAYEKGASLIRMMEGFLSTATMKEAFRKYLNDNQFGITGQDDYFEIINSQAELDGTLPIGFTVKEIMDTWTLQAGFPIIRVRLAPGRNKVYLSQERIVSGKQTNAELDPNHLWHVPIAIVTENEPTVSHIPKLWLRKDIAVTSTEYTPDKWIMINPDATGYYRVLYDYALTYLIIQQLETDHTVISKLSRSQLLDDYLRLAFQNFVPLDLALELTNYLEHEIEYSVWDTVFTNFETIFIRLSYRPVGFQSFKAYLESKLEALIAYIGLEQGTEEIGAKVIFRSLILDWMCGLSIETCTTYASNLISLWMETPEINQAPKESRSVIYCAGVSNGDERVFEFMTSRYVSPDTSEKEKGLLLSALTCSTNSEVLVRLLDDTLIVEEGEFEIRKVDILLLVQQIGANPVGRDLVIEFLINNFDQILEEFEVSGIELIISSLAVHCDTEAEAENIQNFVDEHSEALSEVTLSLTASILQIRGNIEWINSFLPPLQNWLDNNQN